MLVQRHYAIGQMSEVRRLIDANGWALLLTSGPDGLRAAHMPCLLDPERDPGGDAAELVVLGHSARADPQSRDVSAGDELLLVFQGPHGYISAAWYETEPVLPTWNFTAVHVSGVPEVLEGEPALAVLERTVEHFEASREPPWRLEGDSRELAERLLSGIVAFRLVASRVEAKAKLSQDMEPELQDRVIAALDRPGPYSAPDLATEMRRVLARP
jgi:transcriptional regulator